MAITVDHNRVKHSAGVLLEKCCQIFPLHPFKKDMEEVEMLVGDFVDLEELITFIYFETQVIKNYWKQIHLVTCLDIPFVVKMD